MCCVVTDTTLNQKTTTRLTTYLSFVTNFMMPEYGHGLHGMLCKVVIRYTLSGGSRIYLMLYAGNGALLTYTYLPTYSGTFSRQ